ncbi:MAG: 50S ribosomal protein L9 [Lachnospira sp.]|mgnify:CR=1 FL=1|nr:50S ribosomal protein L9 [Lachnospira sp.]
MEIILLEDVKALGKKGEIVKVSDGYARNYILPKKLGLEANAKNLNDLKIQKEKKQRQDELELAAAKEFAVKVEAKPVRLCIKTGKEGRVFGAISSKEISLAAKTQLGLDIDKKKMKLEESIKALGTYEVACKLHKDVTAKLKVVVEEEK